MSNIYVTEPPTNGKVILKTTHGDLDIELWSKECPKACRNFVQLCLEGYYDKTTFHRIVKGFLIQGGDPSGTGIGGSSIYPDGFAEEFHSRLRYRYRGMVGVANGGKGTNTNGSQFFITLDKSDALNNQMTLFGKVTGNTIYNLVSLGELEVDNLDRPLAPPKIISVHVISNPFPDCAPRNIIHPHQAARLAREAQDLEKKNMVKINVDSTVVKTDGPKAVKKQLLSFNNDEEEEENEGERNKIEMVSAHTLLENLKSKKEGREVNSSALNLNKNEASSFTNNEKATEILSPKNNTSNSNTENIQYRSIKSLTAPISSSDLKDLLKSKEKKKEESNILARLENFKSKMASIGADKKELVIQEEKKNYDSFDETEFSNNNYISNNYDDDDNDDDNWFSRPLSFSIDSTKANKIKEYRKDLDEADSAKRLKRS